MVISNQWIYQFPEEKHFSPLLMKKLQQPFDYMGEEILDKVVKLATAQFAGKEFIGKSNALFAVHVVIKNWGVSLRQETVKKIEDFVLACAPFKRPLETIWNQGKSRFNEKAPLLAQEMHQLFSSTSYLQTVKNADLAVSKLLKQRDISLREETLKYVVRAGLLSAALQEGSSIEKKAVKEHLMERLRSSLDYISEEMREKIVDAVADHISKQQTLQDLAAKVRSCELIPFITHFSDYLQTLLSSCAESLQPSTVKKILHARLFDKVQQETSGLSASYASEYHIVGSKPSRCETKEKESKMQESKDVMQRTAVDCLIQ